MKRISPAIFVVTVLCFLLPFVSISSGGAKVGTLSGVRVLTGATLNLPQAAEGMQRIDADPMAVFAVLCVLISLAMSFVATGGLALYPAMGGVIGAASLLVMKFTLPAQIAKQDGGLQASYQPGFFLALLALVAAAAWNFYLFSQRAHTGEDVLVPSSALGDQPVSRSLADASRPETEPEPVLPTTVVEPSATEETTICSHCGATMNVDAKFCTVCGRPVREAVMVVPPAPAPPLVQVTETPTSPPVEIVESPQPAQPDETIICSHCGATLTAESRFCNVCGKPVGALAEIPSVDEGVPLGTAPLAQAEPPATPEVVPAQDPYSIVKDSPKAYTVGVSAAPLVIDAPRRRRKALPLIAAVLLLIVLIVGAGAAWYFQGVDAIIVCSPFDAKAFLDGVELTPESPGRFSVSHLSREPHTLRVQRDGYNYSIQTLDFPVTSTSEFINVRLTPVPTRKKTL